jgi:hypothetical protein
MPTEPEPVTISQIAHRAVEIVDPDGASEDAVDFLRRFEDVDVPASAVEDIDTRVAEVAGIIDPQEESAVVQVARAITVYLAFRRDEVADDPDDVIRLAIRAEYDGNPPPHVANWLDEAGVEY